MDDSDCSSYYLLRWSDHISNYADIFLTLREEVSSDHGVSMNSFAYGTSVFG